MDVTRKYYSDIDDFLRILSKNNHRRRHMPFWNLTLSALQSQELSSLNSSNQPSSSSASSSNTPNTPKKSNSDKDSTKTASENSSNFSRVAYITFHPPAQVSSNSTSTTSPSTNPTTNPDDITLCYAILSPSFIAIFSADDNLSDQIGQWIYAEISAAHRNRGSRPNLLSQTPSKSSSNSVQTSTSLSGSSSNISSTTDFPNSFKPLRFEDRLTLYGSLAHIRAVLDLANLAARDPKLRPSDSRDMFSPASSRRTGNPEYRLSKDDSGMRILGRDARVSMRPSTSEFSLGPTLFKRRIRNAYRLFFMNIDRLETLEKSGEYYTSSKLTSLKLPPSSVPGTTNSNPSSSSSSTSSQESYPLTSAFSSSLNQSIYSNPPSALTRELDDLSNKSLKLASVNDWESIKTILRKEIMDPEDENSNGNDEDNDADFDRTLEAIQKGNVYIWSSTRQSKDEKPKKYKKGSSKSSIENSTKKPKIRCFAVLEFHTTTGNIELASVEVVDLHLNEPRRDAEESKLFMQCLARKFLLPASGSPPSYSFMYVQIDISVPESSDQFLLDCGFVADSVADFEILEATSPSSSGQSTIAGQLLQSTALKRLSPSYQPFEITKVIKVSPLTEKPFTAYEIKVMDTNEIVKKRYREFDKLYSQLKAHFPNQNIPKLPKKRIFGNMDNNFIEKRRNALQLWLNHVALLPGVEESGWVANFLWSELKIRGVKGISEEEKLFRTLQKHAEESRITIVPGGASHPSVVQNSRSTGTLPTSPSNNNNTTQVSPSSSSANLEPPASPIPTTSSNNNIDNNPKTSKSPKDKKDKKGRRLSS